MSYKIERVCESAHLGEGPHWDEKTQSLYYVDILDANIHKYTPATNTHTKVHVPIRTVSVVFPIENQPDKFLISAGNGLAVIEWDGVSDQLKSFEKIVTVDENPMNRINDGKIGPDGRVWCGTMQYEENGEFTMHKGHFVSYDRRDGTVKRHASEISISNGIEWNVDRTKMYYIDSMTGTLDVFDYDIKTGNTANRKPIFTLANHGIEGLLDGQTIDTDGNLWVAVFNAGCVIKVDPRKEDCLLDVIKFPAKQTTSVAFGGPNYDVLYVTSGRLTQDGVVLSPPDHGAVFKVTGLGVRGLPPHNFKL